MRAVDPKSIARLALRGLKAAAPVLTGTVMILAVLWAFGRPNVFPDTDDYVTHGRNLAHAVAQELHLEARPTPPTEPEEIADAREAAQELQRGHAEIASRSAWYGLPLWFFNRYGTLWSLVAVQALI